MAPTACRRMGSGTISLPSSGCFSPFPHGTRTLSVSQEYLALPDGPGGFTQDYSCPALLRSTAGYMRLRIQDCHLLRCNFPDASTRRIFSACRSYYPAAASPRRRFGLLPGRSPLLGESLLFSLPPGTKMFQFPGFASPTKVVMAVLPTAGLSHSEIAGSRDICSSPALIAAYHVLHRLCEPRHPPSALSCFISPMNSRTEKCPKDTQRTGNIAHTFSCIAILI